MENLMGDSYEEEMKRARESFQRNPKNPWQQRPTPKKEVPEYKRSFYERKTITDRLKDRGKRAR